MRYGNESIPVRQGMLFPYGEALTSGTTDFSHTSDFTACFTVYVFEKNQESTLYSLSNLTDYKNYLELMIDDGYLKINSKYGALASSNPEFKSSSSNMYDVGWNMICFTQDTNF